jgi:hypothetical protein
LGIAGSMWSQGWALFVKMSASARNQLGSSSVPTRKPTRSGQQLQAKKRGDDRRRNAVLKMRRALTGKGSTTLTPNQIATLKPQKLRQLRAYSAGRYNKLDAQQRDRLRDNLYLLIATAPDETYMAVANMPPLDETQKPT